MLCLYAQKTKERMYNERSKKQLAFGQKVEKQFGDWITKFLRLTVERNDDKNKKDSDLKFSFCGDIKYVGTPFKMANDPVEGIGLESKKAMTLHTNGIKAYCENDWIIILKDYKDEYDGIYVISVAKVRQMMIDHPERIRDSERDLREGNPNHEKFYVATYEAMQLPTVFFDMFMPNVKK